MLGFDGALFPQLVLDGLVLGCVYALVAVSFGLIYSTTKIFHFAHAVVYVIAAYAAVTASGWGVGWVLASVVAVVAAVVAGLAVERLVYRPLRRKGTTTLGIFLASLGLTIMVPALIQLGYGPENQVMDAFDPKSLEIFGLNLTTLDVASVIVAIVAIPVLLAFLWRSKHGMATTAVRTNPDMAAAVGISVDRVHQLVIGVGSGLVAVAALLFMYNGVATPNMGMTPVLLALIAVFVGGIGSMVGAALGGLLLGMLTSVSAMWMSSEYQSALIFGVLFIFLIVRPQGLLGSRA